MASLVRSGPVPPLAEGFTVRPDTVPGLEAALTPGAGIITITDATALQQAACSCYAIVKAEFDLITGSR